MSTRLGRVQRELLRALRQQAAPKSALSLAAAINGGGTPINSQYASVCHALATLMRKRSVGVDQRRQGGLPGFMARQSRPR